jgi:hypothetical protein
LEIVDGGADGEERERRRGERERGGWEREERMMGKKVFFAPDLFPK